jgi:hypothetical protein
VINELLFVISPFFLGLLFIVGLPRYRHFKECSNGLAPTFFLAVALHFALFANLLSTELWNRVVRANDAISMEVSGLQSMLRIAEASLGTCATQIPDAVQFYKASIQQEFVDTDVVSEMGIHQPLSQLYKELINNPDFIPNPTMKALFTDSLEQVRASRYTRLELKSTHITVTKFIALYIFGCLTLLAIAVYHCANRAALTFTTLLFSFCFSITLIVLVILDRPYAYPHLVSPKPYESAR